MSKSKRSKAEVRAEAIVILLASPAIILVEAFKVLLDERFFRDAKDFFAMVFKSIRTGEDRLNV